MKVVRSGDLGKKNVVSSRLEYRSKGKSVEKKTAMFCRQSPTV